MLTLTEYDQIAAAIDTMGGINLVNEGGVHVHAGNVKALLWRWREDWPEAKKQIEQGKKPLLELPKE